MIREILGCTLIITGILDAIKYSIQGFKIRDTKTAKAVSRKFGLIALLNGIVRLAYSIAIMDWYILISSLLAVVCQLHLWYMIYLYYPYRGRKLRNFRRPDMVTFIINAIIPNKFRKRL